MYKNDWNAPCFRPCATPKLRLENHHDISSFFFLVPKVHAWSWHSTFSIRYRYLHRQASWECYSFPNIHFSFKISCVIQIIQVSISLYVYHKFRQSFFWSWANVPLSFSFLQCFFGAYMFSACYSQYSPGELHFSDFASSLGKWFNIQFHIMWLIPNRKLAIFTLFLMKISHVFILYLIS